MSELTEGSAVGAYRLHKLLGEGGMGAVWAASHVGTGQMFALKFMKGLALTMPEMHKRFIREARAASAVRHPCVVKIHEIISDDLGAPVMVMDYLVGESMGSRLERTRPLPLGEFARIFLQVVSAVGTAHAVGIVHRDLKPDNIFLLRDTIDGAEVRILDFGIAKLTAVEGDAAQTAGLTNTGAMLGTPYYMSPEQVFGDKSIDHRADIWSLGVILFEALSGVKPVNGENLGQILRVITSGQVPTLDRYAPQLPREIVELVGRMLQVERRNRPADLREVYEVFRKYTDVDVERFSAATLQISSEELIAAGLTPILQTGAPLSATAATAPGRSRAPLFIGVGVAAAVALGAIGFAGRAKAPPTDNAAAQPTPTVASTASAPILAESAPAPLAAAPSVSASPAASSATKFIVNKTATKSSAALVPAAAPPPPVAASTPTAAKPAKSLGGVASEIPF